MKSKTLRFRLPYHLFSGIVTLLLTLVSNQSLSVSAAESLTLKVGPIKRTVAVNDLEKFAQSGELSSSLRFYRLLLTPQFRQVLNRKLKIDPTVVDKFVDELLQSQDGNRLIEHLRLALPQTEVRQLQAALSASLQQADGLSAISFLRAYPAQNITINATAAVTIALQLNASYLQSQVLNPLLASELQVEETVVLPPGIDPQVAGEAQVRRRTLILYDRQRQRKIPVDLYYSNNSQGPLVVMSHGFAADRKFLSYLAFHLASHGMSVAALDHPGSNIESLSDIALSINPVDFLAASEFVERPQDISFLLDRLAKLNQYWGSLKGRFNTEQVTVIGHSLGGYTALALAGGELDLAHLRSFCGNHSPLGRSPADWLQCSAVDLPHRKLQMRDERVVQAIALNPLIGKLFGEEGLGKVSTPTMILTGSRDAITPSLHHQLLPFEQLEVEKYLLAAVGGTHMSVTDIGNLKSTMGQSTLVQELMGTEAEPVRQLTQALSLSLIKQLTPEASLYQPFLTPAYVQSLSPTTEQLQLRLTTEIPGKVDKWLDFLAYSNQRLAYQQQETEENLFSQIPISEWATRLLAEGKFMPQAQACTGQLNSYFNNILGNYRHRYRRIS